MPDAELSCKMMRMPRSATDDAMLFLGEERRTMGGHSKEVLVLCYTFQKMV